MDIDKILLTTDLSECSEHAFAPAAAIARRSGAEIDLVMVAGAMPSFAFGNSDHAFWLETLQTANRERLETLAKRPIFDGVTIQPVLLEGHGPEAIDRYQQAAGHDLLVLATHGHTGFRRLVMGSFAERVVQLMRCPVLTFRASSSDADFRPRRILVPYDFSELSHAAFARARELARRFQADVFVLHVFHHDIHPLASESPIASVYGTWPPNFWVDARNRAADKLAGVAAEELPGLHVTTEVLVGAPAREIVAKAAELEADLIVLATHGRSGLGHALMGSVAERVVRAAPCSVLTIRAGS
jgi:nucleotide-binding universal stress UspA family protein